jgi:ketosteroid isomerase-like protein
VNPNHALIRGVMRSYAQGDMAPLMAVASEDIVWSSNAPKQGFRFGGRYAGQLGMKEALSLIASDFEMLRYEKREMVGDGDVVWAASDLEALEKKSRSRLQFELVNRWQFEGGKLVAYAEYFASASLLLQLGRTVTAPGS